MACLYQATHAGAFGICVNCLVKLPLGEKIIFFFLSFSVGVFEYPILVTPLHGKLSKVKLEMKTVYDIPIKV